MKKRRTTLKNLEKIVLNAQYFDYELGPNHTRLTAEYDGNKVEVCWIRGSKMYNVRRKGEYYNPFADIYWTVNGNARGKDESYFSSRHKRKEKVIEEYRRIVGEAMDRYDSQKNKREVLI